MSYDMEIAPHPHGANPIQMSHGVSFLAFVTPLSNQLALGLSMGA